jgi:hypothetical protein
MMATQELREYVMELLRRPDYSVRLNERTRPRIEALPTAEWWETGDGTERVEIKINRYYHYIFYWEKYRGDGTRPNRCLMIRKSSAEGKRIAEMLEAVR